MINAPFETRKKTRHLLLNIIIILTILFCFLFAFFIYLLSKPHEKEDESISKRIYNIVLIGPDKKEDFLLQLNEELNKISAKYNTAITLYIPKTKSQKPTFNEIMLFPSYINADGIIIWTKKDSVYKKIPQNKIGSKIPVITIGEESKDVQKICHFQVDNILEVNYEELAEDALSNLFNFKLNGVIGGKKYERFSDL